jgi:Asp-tRNA(Asn)/Glu-tRNA(Gln) amidotransferase A subunit family amidase
MSGKAELDVSIENLQTLYNAGDLTTESLVRAVYSRISEYHDKAVWITLVPEEAALQRAHSLAQQYPENR